MTNHEEPILVAGQHIIIECEGRHAHLSDAEMGSLLEQAARNAGATILSSHFHCFGIAKGLTGVLLLAESHITVHTWPEHDYAAFDIFMCGACDPQKAGETIIAGATVIHVKTQSIIRGIPSAPFFMPAGAGGRQKASLNSIRSCHE